MSIQSNDTAPCCKQEAATNTSMELTHDRCFANRKQNSPQDQRLNWTHFLQMGSSFVFPDKDCVIWQQFYHVELPMLLQAKDRARSEFEGFAFSRIEELRMSAKWKSDAWPSQDTGIQDLARDEGEMYMQVGNWVRSLWRTRNIGMPGMDAVVHCVFS